MKKNILTLTIISVFTLALFAAPVIAAKIYFTTCLTGGTAGCLDKIDGSGLADGDGSIYIPVTGDSSLYVLDADSAASETSPSIISPDTNAGDKRWLQKKTYSENIKFDELSDVASMSEAQGNLIYWNGTAWTNLAVGTTGQCLKTQGAAANPTWANCVTSELSATTVHASETNAFIVEDTAGLDVFTVSTAGDDRKVGVNITPTNSHFDAALTVVRDTEAYTAKFYRFNDEYDKNTSVMLGRARGTVDAPTTTQDGDILSMFNFTGYSGIQFHNGMKITAYQDGVADASFVPTRVVFANTNKRVPQMESTLTFDNLNNLILGDETQTSNASAKWNLILTKGIAPSAGKDGMAYIYADDVASSTGVFIVDEASATYSFANGTASLNGALTVNSSAADKDVQISASGLTYALFMDGAQGNMGFGTSPSTQFHVYRNTTLTSRFESNGPTALDIRSFSSNANYFPVIKGLRAEGISTAITATQSGEKLLEIQFISTDAGNENPRVGASITGTATENVTPANFGAKLSFAVADNTNSTKREVMLLNQDGSVKIGDNAVNYTTFTASGTQTFTGSAELVLPNGTTIPATCTVGAIFIDTDSNDCADTGAGDGAMCLCKTTNAWVLINNF